MFDNFVKIIEKYGSLFLEGLGITLFIAFITVVIGVILGSLLALMRMSKIKVVKIIATVYVEVVRGLPLLLQLWLIYLVGLNLGMNKMLSVILALGLNSGGYVAEIVRAGIQAVDKGQNEAGISLGLPTNKVMIKIIFPQAIKNILPALGNEFIAVIKETSLASTFFIGDLMTVYKNVSTLTYLSIEPLIVAGALYLFFTFTLSKVVGIFEKRMKKSD